MIDITFDPRAAGEITRYHTWRRTRDQSVGEHTWQVIRIMLTVWPTVPRKLLVHATWHDVGEMVGDIPYPFKRTVPGLRDAMRTGEDMVASTMHARWGSAAAAQLTEYEEDFFKCCENIEMWEWGVEETRRGNAYAMLVAERMLQAAAELYTELAPTPGNPDVRPAIRKYIDNRARQERLHDNDDGRDAGRAQEDARGVPGARPMHAGDHASSDGGAKLGDALGHSEGESAHVRPQDGANSGRQS